MPALLPYSDSTYAEGGDRKPAPVWARTPKPGVRPIVIEPPPERSSIDYTNLAEVMPGVRIDAVPAVDGALRAKAKSRPQAEVEASNPLYGDRFTELLLGVERVCVDATVFCETDPARE